jgi:uncharacterized membrane protein
LTEINNEYIIKEKINKKEGIMSTFIYFLGLIMACVGIAIVAKSFKGPFGLLGISLVILGTLISIFLSERIEKWEVAKKSKKLDEKGGKNAPRFGTVKE